MSLYIDLSGGAMDELAEALKHHVEAVAGELVEEIKGSMEPGPVRTGREYRVPDYQRTYTASAPGEPPAVRTGAYLASWQVSPAVIVGDKVIAAATNSAMDKKDEHFIGEILEYGTTDGKIAPRPHIRPALDTVAQRRGGTVRGGDE